MKDYFELIARRESCRNFADTPVEHEKLVRCAEAARLAPSACNSQPWAYVVVTNPKVCDTLRSYVQELGMNKFVSACNAFAVVVETRANLSEMAAKRFKNQDFASIDIGLSVSQFCYAATEQGLSTCIVGWLNEKKIKELLNIDTAKRVRLVLAVGYAATDALRKKVRKPIEQIVTYIE